VSSLQDPEQRLVSKARDVKTEVRAAAGRAPFHLPSPLRSSRRVCLCCVLQAKALFERREYGEVVNMCGPMIDTFNTLGVLDVDLCLINTRALLGLKRCVGSQGSERDMIGWC
jgi:hypothetical protein